VVKPNPDVALAIFLSEKSRLELLASTTLRDEAARFSGPELQEHPEAVNGGAVPGGILIHMNRNGNPHTLVASHPGNTNAVKSSAGRSTKPSSFSGRA